MNVKKRKANDSSSEIENDEDFATSSENINKQIFDDELPLSEETDGANEVPRDPDEAAMSKDKSLLEDSEQNPLENDKSDNPTKWKSVNQDSDDDPTFPKQKSQIDDNKSEDISEKDEMITFSDNEGNDSNVNKSKKRNISPVRGNSDKIGNESNPDGFSEYVESDEEDEELTAESVTKLLKELTYEALLEVCTNLAIDNLDSKHLIGISESSKKDPERSKVFVSQFSFKITEKDLEMGFNKYGKVIDVSLIRRPDGSHRGFAFVTFSKPKYAEKAVQAETIKCGYFEAHCNYPIRRAQDRNERGPFKERTPYRSDRSSRDDGLSSNYDNSNPGDYQEKRNRYGNNRYGSGYGNYSARRY